MDEEEPIRPSRCWWRGCQKDGELTDLASHRVLLCRVHTKAVAGALLSPGRFEARWGEWTHDVIARKQRQLAELRKQHAALPDVETAFEDWPTDKDRLEWAITELEEAIEDMSEGGDHPPSISVRDLTETAPPVPESGYPRRPPRP